MINFNFERSYSDRCVWIAALRLSSVVFGQSLFTLGLRRLRSCDRAGLNLKLFKIQTLERFTKTLRGAIKFRRKRSFALQFGLKFDMIVRNFY